MDPAWVSAIGTIIAAGIAAFALVVEGRRLNISRGAELLLRLDELFFSSERMDEARKAAAKALRGEGSPKDIDDVLDFFETVGLLVQKGAIDEELVWHTFFYWVYGYRNAAKQYIAEKRSQAAWVWQEFMNLYERLVALEVSKNGRVDPELTAKDFVEKFIKEESGEDESMSVKADD